MAERSTNIVQGCIDYRLLEQTLRLQQKKHARLLTTAGASLNSRITTNALKDNDPSTINTIFNDDHLKCGAYELAGDDSDINHQRHIDNLKGEIREIDPVINFEGRILRVPKDKENQHTCSAAALILGDEGVLKIVLEKLSQEGLLGDFDAIARPFKLTADVIEDLKISLKLHRPQPPKPFTIYIFERDEENAMILEKQATELAPDVKVRIIIVADASEEESVA